MDTTIFGVALAVAGAAAISGAWTFDVGVTSKIAPLDTSACDVDVGELGAILTTAGEGDFEAAGVRFEVSEAAWIVGSERPRLAWDGEGDRLDRGETMADRKCLTLERRE